MPRYFEDYQVGDEVVTPARTIFETDVVNFFCLSGDQNESHSNLELARSRGQEHTAVQWNLVFADRKSTRLNSSHSQQSRMPSSA